MRKTSANLRISYLGGGYDYPEFFQDDPVTIIAEGLASHVTYNGSEWQSSVGRFSGLGGSAAKHLSFLRYYFPTASERKLIDVAIAMDGLQNGGWQDAIASAHEGFIKIRFFQDGWSVEPIQTELHRYRRLYEIPVCRQEKRILSNMVCRASSFDTMQALVKDGEAALKNDDFSTFGLMVTAAWNLKKQWHPDISNPLIERMQDCAKDTGAWGWKVCGAGGQGYFLVIGDEGCHSEMSKKYPILEVDNE